MNRLWTAWQRSLRARIFLPCALLFAVTVGTMVTAAMQVLGRDLEASVEQRAQTFVHLAADGLMAAMAHDGPKSLPDILSVVNEQHDDIVWVSLLRTDGTIVSSSKEDLLGTKLAVERPLLQQDGGGEYSVLRPIANGAKCVRCHGPGSKVNGFIEARFSRRPVEAAKAQLARRLALAAVPSFIALLLIAWWLLGREAVNPLQRLVSTMRRAAAGETVVADEGRPDELGIAARGFDATLAALQRSRRLLEEMYADRMVRADRFAAVGEMATGLAHEIKNPLAGLSGAMELLAEDLAGSPQAEVVGEMQHQVTRLTQTMESLLRFARPPRPQMRSLDVNATLENVLFLVKQQRTDAPIAIERECGEIPTVYGDPAQIEQVFLNLCLNACQAMSAKGGTLRVRSAFRERRVLVEIADSGPGIPPEIQPHLFTPFFTTRRDGNGLGLATSARIVVEHHGRIDFDCPPGGGTVFTITLPPEARA